MKVTLLFLLNTKYYQNEIWSNTSVLHDKHFWKLETSSVQEPFMTLSK